MIRIQKPECFGCKYWNKLSICYVCCNPRRTRGPVYLTAEQVQVKGTPAPAWCPERELNR